MNRLRYALLVVAIVPLVGMAPAHAEVDLAVAAGGTELEDNLRARLRLLAEPCDAPAWRIRRLFRQAEQDLTPALRALGYYRPTIEKTLVSDKACWQAQFRIDPGERVLVRQRSVRLHGAAADDERFQALLAELPLAEGAPLHHGQYEDIKRRLRDLASERGYLDFALTRQQLRVYPEQAAAEIEVEAESGPRYRLGELRLSRHQLDDDFVRRLAGIEPGAPYEAGALTGVDQRLSDSGYFRRVEVQARRDQREDATVPVDVVLEPANRHAWRAGVGFATDTGPRASLRYETRYINQRGHRLESELRLSPVLSGLTGEYQVPGRRPQRDRYSFGVGVLHEENDSAESDSVSLFARHVVKADPWVQTRFVELLHERSDVGGEETEATLLMPGIALERIRVDAPLRIRRGYRINLEARAAAEALGSTATFVQLRASAKGVYRFGEGGRLVGRTEAATTPGDGLSDLPASLRFFAGGDNSVRGYDYKSLGPEDADGEPRGGRHLLTASVEYEHPVFGEDWWVAAFVDGGNAFDTDQIDLRYGYGLGLRWYSPIGRVRLDIAIPDDTTEDDWRLHFGLGAPL